MLGLSTHSIEQAKSADALNGILDYFAVGPVFATNTKPGRPAVGLELVSSVADFKPCLPWFAIGGINKSTARKVRSAGAERIVAVSDVLVPQDTTGAIRDLMAEFRGYRTDSAKYSPLNQTCLCRYVKRIVICFRHTAKAMPMRRFYPPSPQIILRPFLCFRQTTPQMRCPCRVPPRNQLVSNLIFHLNNGYYGKMVGSKCSVYVICYYRALFNTDIRRDKYVVDLIFGFSFAFT